MVLGTLTLGFSTGEPRLLDEELLFFGRSFAPLGGRLAVAEQQFQIVLATRRS
jgi:hypothetical protein